MKKLAASAGQGRHGNVTVLVPENGNKPVAKPPVRANGEVYLCAPVEFFSFDEAYLRRLQKGDRATQEHFVSYFTPLLRLKLRGKPLFADEMKDVEQETFLRVLLAVRNDEIRHAERLGAYVNSTCNHILLEWYRRRFKDDYLDLNTVDPVDSKADLETNMIAEETRQAVHSTLDELCDRDRKILRGMLEDSDKDALCRELGVDRGYLRVLTHRAIGNFKEHYKPKKRPKGTGHSAGTSL